MPTAQVRLTKFLFPNHQKGVYMTLIEKQALANSYANAWRAVKGGNMRVEVEAHGWFTIYYGYPLHPSRVRAEKLLIGLQTLTQRLVNGDARVVTDAINFGRQEKAA